MRVREKILPVAIALAGLAGCTTMNQINRDSLHHYDSTQSQIDAVLPTAQLMTKRPELISTSDLPYVDTHSVVRRAAYPAMFYQTAMLNAPAETVWGLMQRLQTLTGFTVNATDDLTSGGGGVAAAVGLPPPPAGVVDGGIDQRSSAGGAGRAMVDAIVYQGTLKGLLDTIAGNLDATWSYNAESRTIRFYRFETRTFQIATVPGDSSSDASVGSSGGSGIQGGQGQTMRASQSTSKTNFSGKVDIWSSLMTNLKPMLSPAGSIEVDQSTATITVRDRWDRMPDIARTIEKKNNSLAVQVAVNVTVYRVHDAKADNRGFNWSVLYNALGQTAGQFGLTFASQRPTADGLSSLVLNAPVQRADGTTPPFSGSQFFLDALSTLGKTSVVTNASVNTVNNTPAPVKVVQTIPYVAQTTSLLTSGVTGGNSGSVGAGATITQAQVETGFTMQVIPSVQPDGHRMLLQVMLSISSLDAMKTFTSGGQTVQQPQVSSREFLQRQWMKSGQALVLAGFQNSDSSNTIETPLSKSLWAAGGSRTVSTNHDVIVIVITPVASSPKNLF